LLFVAVQASGGESMKEANMDAFNFESLLTGQVTIDGQYNEIQGTQGDDTLRGTTGADAIYGLGGNDTLIGDNGHDRLYGGAGNDLLEGGKGADSMYGGAGDDTIHGTQGADLLNGGLGADTFQFAHPEASPVDPGSRDTVIFNHDQGDVIDLSLMDADTNTDGDQAFTVVRHFDGQAGELVIKSHGAGFVVEGDVNGDGAADFAIDVHATGGLTASDFIL
jgi:serralysin